ncbi:hypothetical protein POM88_012738 [Heracleum sosnowskyi]|uniref:Replication protein A OB domain-containing protein n=1 Tax=Heracleum sosnowskyi TaxID=360622 RepID=A0AAD8IX06_9APIA|nr:hypothetical protein POM88_012738 [Heracleum sosnowskyi]
MWASVSTVGSKDGTNSVTGYNAILLDDDNFHIQAFIYPDKWSQVGSTLTEGGIFEKVVEDDFMIPMHKFEFVDLGDLFEIVNNHAPPLVPDYATDIIGVVENFEKLSPIPTKYGQRNIVKFRICDGRNSPKVTVWGKLAEIMDKNYKPESETPIIAILTSAKLQKFMNSVQISTMPSSKIYFNLDTDVVKSLRKSVQVVETLTLKELTEKTSTDYIKRNVMCFVTIKRVEAGDSWWYYGCNFCHEEVHLLERRKRFRIMVLAHDKTEAVNVVLSDRAVKRLVGKTATMLLEEIEDLAENPPSTLFPQQILDIANKDVTFNILISDDNVLINSTMYNATDAYVSKKSKSSTSETVEEMLQSIGSGFGEIMQQEDKNGTQGVIFIRSNFLFSGEFEVCFKAL